MEELEPRSRQRTSIADDYAEADRRRRRPDDGRRPLARSSCSTASASCDATVGELGIGARYCAQAPALADPIQLRHRLVKPLPEPFRPAASASRLQLIRRLGATARGRPLEPIAVRGLARLGALARGGSEPSQPGAEPGVWWCEHVGSKRLAPSGASVRKGLLRVRAQSPSTLSEASAAPWRLADRGRGSAASSGSKSHGLSPGPAERASPSSRSTSARGIKNRLPIRTAARRSLRIQFRIVWVEARRSSAA